MRMTNPAEGLQEEYTGHLDPRSQSSSFSHTFAVLARADSKMGQEKGAGLDRVTFWGGD